MRHKKRKYINSKNNLTIKLLLFTLFSSFLFCNHSFAQEEYNFDDYVRSERAKEILDNTARYEVDEYSKEKPLIDVYSLVAMLLSCVGLYSIYLTRKRYVCPHLIHEIDFHEYEAEEFMKLNSPIKLSAVININKISKYDLIAGIFDLIRRKILVIEGLDDSGTEKAKIYLDDLLYNHGVGLFGYENFIVLWLIYKVGGGEYFSLAKLDNYLELKSRAAEFDIDYDIWRDEVSEYVRDFSIKDEKTEKWKLFCALVGVGYAALGLTALYITNSLSAILLFCVTFLSFHVSHHAERRSKDAEVDYQKLLICKQYIERMVDEEKEDDELWERLFVYSIPLNNTEKVFKRFNKYEQFYYELERGFEKAIIYSNNIVHMLIDE